MREKVIQLARPANANSAETQKTIIAAAARLFAQRGVDGVSMRVIAGEASTSQATLHHYFGTKAALHQACIDSMYEQIQALHQLLGERLAESASPVDEIASTIRAAYGFARENQDTVRLVYRAVLDRGEKSEPQRHAALDNFIGSASQLIAPISSLEPKAVPGALYCFMLLLNRLALVETAEVEEIWPKEDVEQHLVDMFKRMLGLHEGS